MDPLTILIAAVATAVVTEAASQANRSETLEESKERIRLAIENFVREFWDYEIARELTPLQKVMWEEQGVMVCPHGTTRFQETSIDWLVHERAHSSTDLPPKHIHMRDGIHEGDTSEGWFECYHHYTRGSGKPSEQIHAAWWPPEDAEIDYGY